MQETQVQSLGWEDPLEKEMATHSSILAWRSHEQWSLAGYSLWGRKELDTTEWLTLSHYWYHTQGFIYWQYSAPEIVCKAFMKSLWSDFQTFDVEG